MVSPKQHMIGRLILFCAATCIAPAAIAAASQSFLSSIHHNKLLKSTIPDNGDINPYAMYIAPTSIGDLHQGNVLIGNFNDKKNLQGRGTTIMEYDPSTQKMHEFANVKRHLSNCPGGVGLTTAMTALKSGWVIIGSMPSNDGTTKTRGQGCLIVLNPQGKVAETFTGKHINGPWGNMAVIDHGDKATLFVSNVGFGIKAPGQSTQHKATVLRIHLKIPKGQPPQIADQTVIGSGFGAKPLKSVFVIGPTGLALGKNNTLYVSDAVSNSIVKIPNAAERTDSAGQGQTVTSGGMLHRPLAMIYAPNGDLLVNNALNGKVIEVDPKTGKQTDSRWINKDKAQNPPGSGDLFGLAMPPSGKSFYYVADDSNTLWQAK